MLVCSSVTAVTVCLPPLGMFLGSALGGGGDGGGGCGGGGCGGGCGGGVQTLLCICAGNVAYVMYSVRSDATGASWLHLTDTALLLLQATDSRRRRKPSQSFTNST